jgi:hypothetical protein
MLAQVNSAAVVGLEGQPVEVEVDISGGLPSMTIVDLPDTAVQESREITVPEDLMEALTARQGAQQAFDRLPLSHRKGIIVWVMDAKKPETRTCRIERALDHIIEQR